MYLMFVMVAAGGLMATAQLAPIAKDFKIGDVPVNIMGLVLPALTFALAIDRVLNGLTRPFFGWVSDQIGRELTMFIAFAIEAVGILALYKFGQNPVAFVILTGIVFFAWGEIYSLFPLDLRGHLRVQVRGVERRHALHRQGHGLAAGAFVQRAGGQHRQLACGLHRRQRDERGGGAARLVRAAPAASRAHGQERGLSAFGARARPGRPGHSGVILPLWRRRLNVSADRFR